MDLTRRELCSALSSALLPILLGAKDSDQKTAALPSTMYPYEKLPVQASNRPACAGLFAFERFKPEKTVSMVCFLLSTAGENRFVFVPVGIPQISGQHKDNGTKP